jgi:ribosome-binding protein aMBF1 (putative translation factor)
MAATAEYRGVRQSARRLMQLPKEMMDQITELRRLYKEADSNEDREEIEEAVTEILAQSGADGYQAVDPEAGIDKSARKRVDEYRKRVGKRIKERRERLGMTQERLAEKAGIPQSHVSRLENGQHAPTHVTMARLARALRTRASKLDPGFDD